ncbi:glycosyltransferase family 25 protein [Succinatimonas hippei]|uniref:glycosyltransferase family 25 protein n=1 Tax=Succinatimonas hippei TaxID=626938 RepID=UPI00248FD72E|nr:glycosyltransferase family 25 protein [Succinatimonas hippei]
MQIFVINLKEDIERRQSITKCLNELNLDFEIFNAVKGKDIDRHNDPLVYDKDECLVRHNFLSKTIMRGKLSDGELGCALSHLGVYQEIVKRNLSGAIILEDDFIPNCNLNAVFSAAYKIVPQADIISGYPLGGGLRQSLFTVKKKINIKDFLVYRLGVPGFDWFLNRRRRVPTTACYFISKESCLKLIDIGYPVRFESDVLIGMVAFNKLKYYGIMPFCGTRLNTKSSIEVHGTYRFY